MIALMNVIVGIPRTPEDLIAQGYRVKVPTYVSGAWQAFALNPFGYLGFAWSCLLAVPGALLILDSLVRLTQIAFLAVLSTLTFNLTLPGVFFFILAGTATATWSQLQGLPLSFLGAFSDRVLIGRLLLCGLVGGPLLLVYSLGLGWFIMQIAGLFMNVDQHQIQEPAFLAGLLIALVNPGVHWTFAPLLILDRRLHVWDSIRVSWNVIGRNWWGMLVLDLVLLLPIGLLYTLKRLLPGFCPAFTDTLLRLIMGQEGCHGTEAKVFSGVQA